MASPSCPRILRMNSRISELGRNYVPSFYSEIPNKVSAASHQRSESGNKRPANPAPQSYASPQKVNTVRASQSRGYNNNTASSASQSRAFSSMPQRRQASTVATQCLSCDIDGTIANIYARIEMAKSYHPKPNENYWDMLLDGAHYNMDTPILPARAFLKQWIRETDDHGLRNRVIVYLSGRRSGTEEQTRNWLQEHDFPPGEIIHRVKGAKGGSSNFKRIELKKLKRSYNVVAHLGDRDDDQWASSCAGVRFVRCVDGYWLTKDEVHEQRLGDIITIVRKDKTEDEIAEI